MNQVVMHALKRRCLMNQHVPFKHYISQIRQLGAATGLAKRKDVSRVPLFRS